MVKQKIEPQPDSIRLDQALELPPLCLPRKSALSSATPTCGCHWQLRCGSRRIELDHGSCDHGSYGCIQIEAFSFLLELEAGPIEVSEARTGNARKDQHDHRTGPARCAGRALGSSYSFIKVGVETIPPVTFIAGRTLIAGGILLALIRWRGLAMPRDVVTWRRFMFQACLNSVVPFTLIAAAERSIDAGLATILNATSPIFTFLLTALITRHEPVTLRKLVGVGAGIAGICLIVGTEALGGLGQQLWAQLAVIAATVSYAGAAIFGRNFRGLDPMLPAAGSMICGTAILIPLSLIFDRPWTLSPSTASVLALLGLSVFSTALAFSIFFRLIHTLGSVGTTSQAYLRVPIGVGIGALFLGESLGPTAWFGMGFVVAGVAAMTIPARKAAPAG